DALLAPPPLTIEQQADLAVQEERAKRSRQLEEQMQDAMAAIMGPDALRALKRMFATYFDRTGGLDSPADGPAPPPPGDDVDAAAPRERPDADVIRQALEHADTADRVQIEQRPEPPPRDAALDAENDAHGKYGCVKLSSAPFWMHVPGCPDYFEQDRQAEAHRAELEAEQGGGEGEAQP
ncbi:MAG: hypothetical protein KGK07_17225, partial [Chloroflexota bacterium]|nr:hypothetical protein [Chloroflexota bacterium]